MPRFFSCDHCGRTGVTFGIVYPNKDITQPAIRLCQTQDGVQIEPNCYHLVTERGEPLGLRKESAILDTDRRAPKIEATQIRFDQNTHNGLVLSEVVQGDHPMTGQPLAPTQQESVIENDDVLDESGDHPLTGERFLIGEDAEPTDAEKGKGIINVHGADQRPLIDPNSPEGTAILDAAAQEEARKIPPNTTGKTFQGGNAFPTPEAEWRSGPTEEFPNRPVRDAEDRDKVAEGFVPGQPTDTALTDTEQEADEQAAQSRPASTEPDAKSPAQIAAEAQAKADAEDAAKERPEKQSAAKKAATKAPAAKKAATTP